MAKRKLSKLEIQKKAQWDARPRQPQIGDTRQRVSDVEFVRGDRYGYTQKETYGYNYYQQMLINSLTDPTMDESQRSPYMAEYVKYRVKPSWQKQYEYGDTVNLTQPKQAPTAEDLPDPRKRKLLGQHPAVEKQGVKGKVSGALTIGTAGSSRLSIAPAVTVGLPT